MATTTDRRWTLAALCALSLGCATFDARTIRLGAARRPLAPTAAVTLYRAPVTTLRGREVALLELTGFDESITVDRALVELRDMARSVGASAIVWLGEYRARGFYRVIASAVTPER